MKTKHLRLMQRAYVILFFCFMYLPIAYMVVFSFNQSKGYALFTGFTFKWYTLILDLLMLVPYYYFNDVIVKSSC